MINKTAENDYSSIIQKFIRKITLVLINSRTTNDEWNGKEDRTFLLSQKENNDYLDDFFMEDYDGKKKNGSTTSIFFLEFYYHRQGFKCLLEKWKFYYDSIDDSLAESKWKQCVILLRTIYSFSRMLPCYFINKIEEKNKSQTNGKIDYRLYLNKKNMDRFSSKVSSILSHNIENSLMKINVEYLSMNDFTKLDKGNSNSNLHVNSSQINPCNPIKQRPRYFSLDEKKIKQLYEVMACYHNEANIIDNDYFSNDSGSSDVSKKNKNDNRSEMYHLSENGNDNMKKKRTLFFNNSEDDKSLASFTSSITSNDSFQLDIIQANDDSQEVILQDLVIKEKKPSMHNLQIDNQDDSFEVIACGINEATQSIVSHFLLLKDILKKKKKRIKMDVISLTQLYRSFLLHKEVL